MERDRIMTFASCGRADLRHSAGAGESAANPRDHRCTKERGGISAANPPRTEAPRRHEDARRRENSSRSVLPLTANWQKNHILVSLVGSYDVCCKKATFLSRLTGSRYRPPSWTFSRQGWRRNRRSRKLPPMYLMEKGLIWDVLPGRWELQHRATGKI